MPTALILGSSSGFGAASCRALATGGYDIVGVHLDRRNTMPLAEAVIADVEAAGRSCQFFNANAASEETRTQVVEACGPVDLVLHSLAFGSLRPLVPAEGERGLSPKQLTMTMEVMAHSLVWWVRDLAAAGKLARGGSVFALTSDGSTRVIPSYGAVAAAKSALENHIRQLAVELAPLGVRSNCVMAGVTDTPALRKIPGNEALIAGATARNPSGRLTTPEDVAQALVALARPELAWMTGNVIRIDGGEGVVA